MGELNKEALKGRTIRTSDEAYEKFRKIAQDNFESQGQCFSTLIHLFELEQGKAVLGERKMEIENFQMHINALLNMFVNSLQMNEDAEERVRSGVQDIIDLKERNIVQLQKDRSQLQEQLDAIKLEKEELQHLFEQSKEHFSAGEEEHHRTIEQLNQTISDRQEMILLLTSQKDDLQKQIALGYEKEQELIQLRQKEAEQSQKIIALTNEIALSKQLHEQEVEKLEHQLELEKEKLEFNHKKELLEKEKNTQISLEKQKEEYEEKLKLYEEKYLAAVEKIEQLSVREK